MKKAKTFFNNNKFTTLFFSFYLLLALLLFFYSFTQVDLSLTLSRASVWQSIQKGFQYVGYFNRPLSTIIYGLLLLFLFIFYLWILLLVKNGRIHRKQIWIVLFLITGILTLSYNAFSYDLFNYIFDAKIITMYHQNPYSHKALDYPGDPMLSFMRWTHRTYPYGPVWLLVTVPLSFIGSQYFILTLVLFKAMIAACFLGTVYFIEKIMKILAPEKTLFAIAFFAFNPLVLTESLVSSHIDIVMLLFCVYAIYATLQRKYTISFISFFLSVGVKFATIFLLPIFLYVFYARNKQVRFRWDRLFFFSIIIMFFAVVVTSIRNNFEMASISPFPFPVYGLKFPLSITYQPWYLLLILPFASFIADRQYILFPTVILSVTSLLNYIPYLFNGSWDESVMNIILSMNVSGLVIAIITGIIFYIFGRKTIAIVKQS